MGLLDDALAGPIADIIDIFTDVKVTLRRRVVGTYDGTTGAEGSVVTTDYLVKATPPSNYETAEVNGDTVLATDLKLDIAASALSVTPTPATDTLLHGGVTYQVVSVTPTYGGDSPLLWTLQLRR